MQGIQGIAQFTACFSPAIVNRTYSGRMHICGRAQVSVSEVQDNVDYATLLLLSCNSTGQYWLLVQFPSCVSKLCFQVV